MKITVKENAGGPKVRTCSVGPAGHVTMTCKPVWVLKLSWYM